MIRIATAADAPAIADIFNENIEERGFANGALIPDSPDERARSLAASDARHPTFAYVDANGDIVGWCALKPLSTRPSWPDVAEVALYVKRSSRNRVIGAQLLVQLLDAARVREFRSLVAMVLAKNRASQRGLGFAGFAEVARVRDAAFLHGHWVDILWLQKDLDCEEEPSIAFYASRFRTEAFPVMWRETPQRRADRG